MKLLLTSGGLTNDSIKDALEELVGKPRKEIKIAFIPTASLAEDDGSYRSKGWLIDNLHGIKEFCGFVDVVSLADLPSKDVVARLERADVIFVGGGNAFYLSYWMEKSGLFDALPQLLETRVYAGISAGTMIATPSLRTASQAVKNPEMFHDKRYDGIGPKGRSSGRTAGLVNFLIRPHFNSPNFPNIDNNSIEAAVADIQLPLYAIDDNTALKIVDGELEVVTEGEWRLFKS